MATSETEIDRRFLTVPQAAERYQVGERTIQRWIRQGVIPVVRVGPKLVRIDVDELDRALAS